MANRRTIRQIVLFIMVGTAATLTHIAIAWLSYEQAAFSPVQANFAGAIGAFFVSYIGNAVLTFNSRTSVRTSAPRYLIVSSLSFLLATAIMTIVTGYGLPTYVYAAGVLIVIPPTTFLLSKFWVFGASDKHMRDQVGKAP